MAVIWKTCLSFALLEWLGSHSILATRYCPNVDPVLNGGFASKGLPYVVGDIINFTCNSGYRGHGKEIIYCTEEGRWSDPMPYCTAIDCRRDENRVEEGRSCRKPCRTDADCTGAQKQCLCDDWCGRSCFNPDENCSAVDPPDNGYIVGKDISYGYTVTYGCNERFILAGHSTRRCHSDKKWSGYDLLCVEIECPTVFAPMDVSMIVIPMTSRFYVGTELSFSCNGDKYLKEGPSSITCLPDGTWSDVRKPVCEVAGIRDKWSDWSMCTKSCDGGMQYKNRVCKEVNCTGTARNQRRCNTSPCPNEWTPWSSWSLCTAACEGARYKRRTCGRSSDFLTKILGCKGRAIQYEKCGTVCGTRRACPTVSATPHISLEINPKSPHFYVGTEVKFICNEGKYLSAGPRKITCLSDGSWSDSQKPVCKDEWTPWSSWSACTATCEGVRYKIRTCRRASDFITRILGCKGPSILYEKCATVCGTDSKCGDGDSICLQGGIRIDKNMIVNQLADLLGKWIGRKKK